MFARQNTARQRAAMRSGVSSEDSSPSGLAAVGFAADSDKDNKRRDGDGFYEHRLAIEALKHAWLDLTYHSDLRIAHMRFFLLVIGALMAGFGQAYVNGEMLFALAASATGCLIAVVFCVMDVLDTGRGNYAFEAVIRLQNAVATWLEMPEFRMAQRSRGLSHVIPRWTMLRIFLSPTRNLILIGLFLSFGAYLVSIKGVFDNVCPVGSKNRYEFGQVFCQFAQPQADFVGGLQILRPSKPTRHYLIEIVSPPPAGPAAGRKTSPTAPSPGNSASP